MKNLIKFIPLLFLLFLLIPDVVLASDAGSPAAEAEETLTAIIDRPVNTEEDYAHKWFKEIFGGFIFAPWQDNDPNGAYDPNEKTLISQAVGFTNILALALGVVIIYYVFIGGAINAAGKGEAMGQNWSATWLPLRTMSGFGLIMPVSGLGGGALSLAQVFIIWLIMLGSNAASSLWTTLVGEITNGVQITKPNYTLNGNQVYELSKMIMCADVLVEKEGSGSVYATIEREGPFNDIEINAVQVGGVYRLNKGVDMSFALKGTDEKPVSSISFGPDGSCGEYVFPEDEWEVGTAIDTTGVGSHASDYKVMALNQGYRLAREGVGKVIDKLEEAVFLLRSESDSGDNHYSRANLYAAVLNINNKNETSASQASIYNNKYGVVVDNFKDAANEFTVNLPNNVHNKLVSGQGSSLSSKIQEDIVRGGWAAAGMWFFEIGTASNLSYSALTFFMEDQMASTATICSNSPWSVSAIRMCKKFEDEYASGLALLEDVFAIRTAATPNASEVDKIKSTCTGTGGCTIDPLDSNTFATNVGADILNLLADDITTSNPVGLGQPIVSPFQTIQSIGTTMNNTAAIGYSSLIALQFAMSYMTDGYGLQDLATDIFTGGQGNKFRAATGKVFENLIAPVLFALITALVSMGFTLAYVIPFMPITTWTLMIIGYLITVIEAVIAAPLAVIMMITPEGEGIAGTRLERAMQLIATAILKPSLMVIGLVASITIGYVGFQIWNLFFFTAAEHVLTGSVMDIVAVLAVYTTTTFTLCGLFVGIMHRLPNQILEWFSSGVSRPFGEDSAESGLKGAAEQLKGLVQGAGSGIGQVVSEGRRERARDSKQNGAALKRLKESIKKT